MNRFVRRGPNLYQQIRRQLSVMESNAFEEEFVVLTSVEDTPAIAALIADMFESGFYDAYILEPSKLAFFAIISAIVTWNSSDNIIPLDEVGIFLDPFRIHVHSLLNSHQVPYEPAEVDAIFSHFITTAATSNDLYGGSRSNICDTEVELDDYLTMPRYIACAIECGYFMEIPDVRTLLWQSRVNVDEIDIHGRSALMWVAGSVFPYRDERKNTGLTFPERTGNNYGVACLLAASASVNVANREGMSPLMSACVVNHTVVVATLIAAKADVNLLNGCQETALILAARHGSLCCVQQLVNAGADLELRDEEGNTALTNALENGHKDVYVYLQWSGAQCYTRSTARCTLLMSAIAGSNADLVRDLSIHGDIDAQDIQLRTPLMVAAGQPNVAITEGLLDARADISACDDLGYQALYYAVTASESKQVQCLISRGAAVHIHVPHYTNYLLLATVRRNTARGVEVVSALIQAGLPLDECDEEEGYTPLANSLVNDDVPTAKLLLQAKATVDVIIDDQPLLVKIMSLESEDIDTILPLLLETAREQICPSTAPGTIAATTTATPTAHISTTTAPNAVATATTTATTPASSELVIRPRTPTRVLYPCIDTIPFDLTPPLPSEHPNEVVTRLLLMLFCNGPLSEREAEGTALYIGWFRDMCVPGLRGGSFPRHVPERMIDLYCIYAHNDDTRALIQMMFDYMTEHIIQCDRDVRPFLEKYPQRFKCKTITYTRYIAILVHCAAISGVKEPHVVLKDLVNFDAVDEYGRTALMWACGAYIDTAHPLKEETPPFKICSGYLHAVRSLVSATSNLDAVDKNGMSALMWGCLARHNDSVYELLAYAESTNQVSTVIDMKGAYGTTALMCAARCDNVDAVNTLLLFDPSLVLEDENYYTALTHAVRRGNRASASLLLNAAPTVFSVVDKPIGPTTLLSAMEGGDYDIVKDILTLFPSAAYPSQNYRQSPILYAVRLNRADFVSVLVQASVNATPSYEEDMPEVLVQKALAFATSLGHLVLAEFLESYATRMPEKTPPPRTLQHIHENMSSRHHHVYRIQMVDAVIFSTLGDRT